jgi:hypothetical protein
MGSTRAQAVARVRQQLVQQGFPRLQMALIVVLTGGFGLLASFCLLQAGLGSMALRYPLALCVAYLFFLGLIWLWLRTQADDWLNAVQLPDAWPGRTGDGSTVGVHSGGGGDFAGGGASGSFDSPAGAALDNAASSPLKAVGDAASSGPDLDEMAIPLAAIGLALGLALASLYVVYIAPLLLAEVLVDGALAYALFRHLRGQDPQHWLASTWRHTWLPFLATAVVLAAVGAGLAWHTPGAKSIGQALGRSPVTGQAP